jgi:dTDP-4-dehydrorhamnose reductase
VRELELRGLGVRTLGRHDCDLSVDLGDPDTLAKTVADAAPRWVLNCAARADMATCQEDPRLASRINGKAPAVLAETAPGRFLQVSTDLVFAGDKAPYESSAKPRPLSIYGMTKAAGERVLARNERGVVVRVPLLFGPSQDQQRGATDMLLRAIRQKQAVVLYIDEFRTPLHVADAARGLVDILLDEETTGIRHLGGYERLSRFDLAMRFAKIKDLPIDWFEQGRLDDPRRPRDVSLVGDWEPGRELDAALAEC